MKKILFFVFSTLICATDATAAVRDENATNRQTNVAERGTNTAANVTARTATTNRTNNTNLSTRNATNTIPASAGRTAIRTTTQRQTVSTKTNAANASRSASTTVSRSAITSKSNNVTSRPQTQNVSRAAIDQTADVITETRTGAAYEQCKNAYFTCMDQFCSLKNDDYRRCSCSNRVFELTEVRNVMQDAANQLTEFTENLDEMNIVATNFTSDLNMGEELTCKFGNVGRVYWRAKLTYWDSSGMPQSIESGTIRFDEAGHEIV